MTKLADRVHAELENIFIVIKELEKIADKADKSVTELAGIGTFPHIIIKAPKVFIQFKEEIERYMKIS